MRAQVNGMDAGMGDRHSDSGAPGHRRVHFGDVMSGPEGAALEALFAAMPEACVGPEGEQRAVAAFRAAQDTGAHRARTRRRDDWRPRAQRRAWRSVRAAVALSLAGLTLSGVGVAAIGVVRSSDDGDGDRRPSWPSAVASSRGGAGGSPAESHTPSASATPDRQATAQDTEAHCRVYEKGRGKALDATVWQLLVETAGGEKNVAAYCVEQLGRTAGDKEGKAEKTKKAKQAEKTPELTKPAKPTKPEKP